MVTSTGIYIRVVNQNDKQHTLDVHKTVNAAFRSDDSWTTDTAVIDADRISFQELEQVIDANGNPNVLFYAFEEDKVVGTILICVQSESQVMLSMLAVRPSHQSKGVGRQLVEGAIKYVEEHMAKVKMIVVHVFQYRTELTTWYGRMGFKDDGEVIPFAYPEKLSVKDAPIVVMKYRT